MGLFQLSNKSSGADKNGRRVLMQELENLQGECFLVMRRADMMAPDGGGKSARIDRHNAEGNAGGPHTDGRVLQREKRPLLHLSRMER